MKDPVAGYAITRPYMNAHTVVINFVKSMQKK